MRAAERQLLFTNQQLPQIPVNGYPKRGLVKCHPSGYHARDAGDGGHMKLTIFMDCTTLPQQWRNALDIFRVREYIGVHETRKGIVEKLP